MAGTRKDQSLPSSTAGAMEGQEGGWQESRGVGGVGTAHPVLAAGVLERTQHQRRAAALLQVARQVLPCHRAHAALVGAGHGQARTLVLVALGPQKEKDRGQQPDSPLPTPHTCHLERASPGWCQRRTPWCSRCKAGCAWGTQRRRAGPAGAASYGRRTCSHSTRSPEGTRLRGSAEMPRGAKLRVPGSTTPLSQAPRPCLPQRPPH